MAGFKDIVNESLENLNISSDPLSEIKEKALSLYKENGIPTLKHEDWKYSNLGFLNRIDFKFDPTVELFPEGELNQLMIPGLSVNLIIFINGEFNRGLSSFVETKGIKISSLKSEIEDNNPEVLNKLGTLVDLKKHSFGQLNTAFSKDGIYLKIDDNTELEKPLHLINIVSSKNSASIVNTRNLIDVGKNSKGMMIITNRSISENDSLINNVSEIFVDENSKFDLYQIQNDSNRSNLFNLTQVKQEANSKFIDNTVSVSGNFVRNDLRTELAGEFAETYYNGLYVNDGKTHVDNHTFVDHAVANCHSNEFYKGIMDENSKAVFNGKVLVRKDAQKTDAYQQNRNIVLTDSASINTKPELEIYADDVKCSHGATTGKLDDEALFYMRQRGIDPKLAKSLLMFTFCYEIIERMESEEMKSYIGELIHNKLGV